MSLLDKVMLRHEFALEPPVMVDIGASGAIHPAWKKIARYAICIAFDADDRDFHVKEEVNGSYKKLYTYNRVLSTNGSGKNDFYLTRSPHCSSMLKPDMYSLEKWAYAKKFEVENKITLPTTTLTSVLQDLKISKIDWYKSDSQGIDLKLFKSLSEDLRNGMIIAEFEPGILDAYEGEDKMHHILSYMDENAHYWLSKLDLKGTQRITRANLRNIFRNDFLSDVSPYINKTAPGWGEMVFINTFERIPMSKRTCLLGWVMATLQDEHGFAYQLALRGSVSFEEDAIFEEMARSSAMKVRLGMISLKYFSLLARKSSTMLKKSMHLFNLFTNSIRSPLAHIQPGDPKAGV